MKIRILTIEADIERCFPLMSQLRPHLDLEHFKVQVGRQIQSAGYTLVIVEVDNIFTAAMGFRVTEYLAWGKVLYIDDLVTDRECRGKGYAGSLLDWVFERAKALGCQQIHLDSGYQRNDAHRLYLNKKMKMVCHHFSREIKDK